MPLGISELFTKKIPVSQILQYRVKKKQKYDIKLLLRVRRSGEGRSLTLPMTKQ